MTHTLPNFLIAGAPKCATTWLHRTLEKHPQIYLNPQHEVHYFDIHFHHNLAWYSQQFFSGYEGQQAIGEATTSYIRAQGAPQRIAEALPDVKLIFLLRNPIDRAYSHYWHERRKGKIVFEFQEIFENYDLFEAWVTTGFYYTHLARFYDYFPQERVLVLLQDDVKKQPDQLIHRTLTFLGVDTNANLGDLNTQVNVTRTKKIRSFPYQHLVPKGMIKRTPRKIRKFARKRLEPMMHARMDRDFEQGMGDDTRKRLAEIYAPETQKLADLLNVNLDHWV